MPVDMSIPNSILSSYFAGRQMRMKQEDQQMEQEKFKAQLEQQKLANKLAQQQEARLNKQLELYQQYGDAEMKRAQARLEAERQDKLFEAHQKVIGDVASNLITPQKRGGEPIASRIPQQQQNQNFTPIQQPPPITSPVRQVVQVGGQEFDVSNVTPFEEQQRRALEMMRAKGGIEALIEGAKAGSKAQAELPYKVFEQSAKDQAALERVKLTNEGRERAASISAAARRYAADKSHEVDEGALADNATLAYYGQQGRILGNNKQDIATKRIIMSQGGVPLDPKTSEKLKTLHDTDVLYDRMKAFVDKLPDNALGANFDKYIRSNPVLMNEFSNMDAAMRGYSGTVARELGRETGRLTDQDRKAAMGIMVTPGITKKMAITRLGMFHASTSGAILNGALGGVPDKQRVDVLKHYGYDPTTMTVPDGRGGYLRKYVQTSDGKWEYYDPTSKTYKIIEEKSFAGK